MTCKDCMHYKLCEIQAFNGFNKNFEPEKDWKHCGCFKDKSKYIELPCKVGDTTYHYYKSVSEILPYVVEDIYIDKEQTRYFATAFNVYYNEHLDGIEFTEDEIGKTVFLTKSEAEQKLKELKENS